VVTVERALTGIAVTTPPTKRVYALNEAFDPAGMVVTATYSDGSTAEIPHGELGIGVPDSATAGSRIVTITYRDDNVSWRDCGRECACR